MAWILVGVLLLVIIGLNWQLSQVRTEKNQRIETLEQEVEILLHTMDISRNYKGLARQSDIKVVWTGNYKAWIEVDKTAVSSLTART